jgi:UDP-N-acetylglucosamine:LPS N-acetylglucosamine transferase
MRDVIHRYAPDAIVTTYPLYQAPLEAYFIMSRRYIPVFTVVTDLVTVHRTWLNEAVDRCLVPTPQVRELALEVGLRPSQVVVTGIPVHPKIARETRSPEQIRTELGLRSDLTTALVVGSRRVSRLPETLRALNHSGLPLQLVMRRCNS